jgi:hypothetical protein
MPERTVRAHLYDSLVDAPVIIIILLDLLNKFYTRYGATTAT